MNNFFNIVKQKQVQPWKLGSISKRDISKKLWGIIAIVSLLVLFRHVFLYHAQDIKELLVWLKGYLGWKALLIGGIAYMLLLSIPFFPGVELGWLLILLFGKEAVILIYCFTLAGLSLSFFIGRRFEKSWLTSGLDIQSLKRLFHERTVPVVKRLKSLAPRQFSNFDFEKHFCKYYYIILAILINTPGNTIVGGGGGIAFICGISHNFSWKGFILTIALATAPLPLLLYFGFIQIEAFVR